MCKARRLLTGFLALLLVLGAGVLTFSRLKPGAASWSLAPEAAARGEETMPRPAAAGRVSANHADAEELCTVKGIGPKLAAAIKEHGTVANFVRQDQGDLVDWVRRRFRALGKDIDSRLALDMIFLCGDLMTNLIGEIEKVGAYARQKHITMGDIQAVATPQLDAVVFRMTDAIGEGKFDQAMSVLGELYQMQEPPIKIMWSVGRQMRQLYSARLALEQGRGPAYVAQLWGIKPYPSEKLMRSAKRFSLKWCRRAVVRCGQIDLAMKSSGQDGKELLTGLMLELANPV